MKKTKVVVPWDQGLHARPATKLVKLARTCRSSIYIKAHERVADAKSIFSVLLLCATVGTLLEIEVSGDDELYATSAIEQLFEFDGTRTDPPKEPMAVEESEDESGYRS